MDFAEVISVYYAPNRVAQAAAPVRPGSISRGGLCSPWQAEEGRAEFRKPLALRARLVIPALKSSAY